MCITFKERKRKEKKIQRILMKGKNAQYICVLFRLPHEMRPQTPTKEGAYLLEYVCMYGCIVRIHTINGHTKKGTHPQVKLRFSGQTLKYSPVYQPISNCRCRVFFILFYFIFWLCSTIV